MFSQKDYFEGMKIITFDKKEYEIVEVKKQFYAKTKAGNLLPVSKIHYEVRYVLNKINNLIYIRKNRSSEFERVI